MHNLTQLILDTEEYNIVLPESIKDGYSASKQIYSNEIEMISGRIIREIRGYTWNVRYQYGIFDNETYVDLIRVCEKGIRNPIQCKFFVQEENEMLEQKFWVTSYERPKFMFSRDGNVVWVNFSVNLIGASIHDK